MAYTKTYNVCDRIGNIFVNKLSNAKIMPPKIELFNELYTKKTHNN